LKNIIRCLRVGLYVEKYYKENKFTPIEKGEFHFKTFKATV